MSKDIQGCPVCGICGGGNQLERLLSICASCLGELRQAKAAFCAIGNHEDARKLVAVLAIVEGIKVAD